MKNSIYSIDNALKTCIMQKLFMVFSSSSEDKKNINIPYHIPNYMHFTLNKYKITHYSNICNGSVITLKFLEVLNRFIGITYKD